MAIAFVFNGANRTIQITALATDYVNNTLTFSAQSIYSAWKAWCKNGVGLQYPPVFDTLGGDPITATTLVGDYYFMRTDLGWRGLPPAVNGVIIFLQGNLYPRVPGDVVMEPLPAHTTTLIMQASSLTQTVVSGGTTVLENKINSVKATVDNIATKQFGLSIEQHNQLMQLVNYDDKQLKNLAYVILGA